MARPHSLSRAEIQEKIDAEKKQMEKHRNRMNQLRNHPFVSEYINHQIKANDCEEEIHWLLEQLKGLNQ